MNTWMPDSRDANNATWYLLRYERDFVPTSRS